MNLQRIRYSLRNIPTHVLLIVLCVVWLVPTIGLLVTSFRPFQDITSTGWWQVFAPPKGASEYKTYCASCHGSDGKALPAANLSDPEKISGFKRSIALMALLNKPIDDQPHLGTDRKLTEIQVADTLSYLRVLSGITQVQRFTFNNYIDALTGYRGEKTYLTDCAAHTQPNDITCSFVTDLMNPRSMSRAFLNSLAVAIPSSLLPILFAAFAAYAFSWFNFRGRQWMFALLVGLQVVPLQMTLIPVSKVYAQLHMTGTFLGIWLFHTGFGLPYAIYLMRNFLGSLPRELFESAYLDGASHWTAFHRLALPLSVPAIASLGIFQFLWIWNDLLVALVFLGSSKPVLTYQISNMVTSKGAGWQLLTAAAFISMALPMIVFFSLQRFFVRGMLAGAVKG